MNKSLAIKLVEKGVLGKDTEIESRYPSVGMGGATTVYVNEVFLIAGVRMETDNVRFELISTRDGRKALWGAETIVAIDGMDPVRFASVYNVKADGVDAKQGKRRGRKPKVRVKDEV